MTPPSLIKTRDELAESEWNSYQEHLGLGGNKLHVRSFYKLGFDAASAIYEEKIRGLAEALEFYENHESVIKEAYHSNDTGQITCVHTFINHKAKEALRAFREEGE